MEIIHGASASKKGGELNEFLANLWTGSAVLPLSERTSDTFVAIV
jgi:hypothetical protein